MFSQNHLRPVVRAVFVAGLCAAMATPVASYADWHSASNSMRSAHAMGRENDTFRDAREQVTDALSVVRQMQGDPELRGLMARARGILIIPDYLRIALGIGGRGGEGVMMVKQPDGQWSNPAFYNVGGASVGFQAGGEMGSVAFLLMTDRAVNRFKQENNFSLGADADLSIINYSAHGQANTNGDVVAWTDTEGLFGGAALNVMDVAWDDDENEAYYNDSTITADRLFDGRVNAEPKAAAQLKDALPL